MYNKGNIKNLTPIDEEEIEKFIISPLDEKEYFNCNKENLVLLRDYLLDLKEQKKKYDKLIAEPLKSIQEKNAWCLDIQPLNDGDFSMKAKAKNYPSISIGYLQDELFYSGIGGYPEILSWLYEKRYNTRKKIITNSKEELEEIKNIIRSIGFLNCEEGFVTSSDRFLVIPRSFEEVHIQKRGKTCFYHEIKLDKDGKFKSNQCGLTRSSFDKTREYADSFVKKLYLIKK